MTEVLFEDFPQVLHPVLCSGCNALLANDVAAENDEQKEHDVTVKSFEMSKFEVTVWEWKQFIKANKMKMPEKPSWGWQDNYPINGITWNEAIA